MVIHTLTYLENNHERVRAYVKDFKGEWAIVDGKGNAILIFVGVDFSEHTFALPNSLKGITAGERVFVQYDEFTDSYHCEDESEYKHRVNQLFGRLNKEMRQRSREKR